MAEAQTYESHSVDDVADRSGLGSQASSSGQASLNNQADPSNRTSSNGQASSSGQAKPTKPSVSFASYWPLWPYILGMACARSGLIVACYGSYQYTDNGIFTEGAMLVTLAVFGVALIALFISKYTFADSTVVMISHGSITIEALCLLMLASLSFAGIESFSASFSLCVLCTIASSLAMFYWLRRMRGVGTAVAAIFVFSSLMLSEVFIYVCSLLPVFGGNLLGSVIAILQLLCMIWEKRVTPLSEIASSARKRDYFGFTKSLIESAQFLIATAISIIILAFVIGLLRGYPDGLSIGFTPATRVGYGLMTIFACVCLTGFVLRKYQRVMTVGIFLLMETLACLSLVLYAAFPDMLDIGAMFTTTLNALMCAYCWYVIIAFTTYGWRDPYYYEMAGWLACFASRGVARMLLLVAYPAVAGNNGLMNAIMGALVVFSTQVALVMFGVIEHNANVGVNTNANINANVDVAVANTDNMDDLPKHSGVNPSGDSGASSGSCNNPCGSCNYAAERAVANKTNVAVKPTALTKIMGLDGIENQASMRQASMRHSAEIVGKQFLLSEREVDVLALYALGFTQKRVAEELYITPSTAHAHIKRIYAKCGMHSRQEILDYIEKYAS